MPAMIGLLGDRVRHAVFVACTVPEDGRSAFDTLDPEIQAMIQAAPEPVEPRPMDAEWRGSSSVPTSTTSSSRGVPSGSWPKRLGSPADPVDLSPLRCTDAAHLGPHVAGHHRAGGQAVSASPTTSGTARWSTSTPATCAWSASRSASPRSSTTWLRDPNLSPSTSHRRRRHDPATGGGCCRVRSTSATTSSLLSGGADTRRVVRRRVGAGLALLHAWYCFVLPASDGGWYGQIARHGTSTARTRDDDEARGEGRDRHRRAARHRARVRGAVSP